MCEAKEGGIDRNYVMSTKCSRGELFKAGEVVRHVARMVKEKICVQGFSGKA